MSDYLTIVRSAQNKPINKRVHEVDGEVSVEYYKNDGHFIAETVYVPNPAAMLELLEKISNRPDSALIMGYVPGTENGDEFAIASKAKFKKNGGNTEADTVQWVDVPGSDLRTTIRAKKWMVPSTWQQIDRDTCKGMPANLANLTDEGYLGAMAKVIPGLDTAAVIKLPSSSGRLIIDGEKAAGGGSRFWFQIHNAEKQLNSAAMLVRAETSGVAFMRPWGAHQRLWSIFDPTVYSHERLVFDGKPVSELDYVEIADNTAELVHGGGKVDTYLIPEPTIADRRRFNKRTGMEYKSSLGRYGIGGDAKQSVLLETASLKLSTEVECWIDGAAKTLTVDEYLNELEISVRCQATFRESTSWNGILNYDSFGIPFLFDNGLRVLYRLNDADAVKYCSDVARSVLAEEPDALMADDVLRMLAVVKDKDKVAWNKLRNSIKGARKVVMRELDAYINEILNAEGDDAQTNPDLARAALAEYGNDNLLYWNSEFWCWDDGCWQRLATKDTLQRAVQDVLDYYVGNQWSATKVNDIVSIMGPQCVRDADWDSGDPEIINCANGELTLVDGQWVLLPHRRDHYFTAKLPVVYDPKAECPMFDQYLADVFRGDSDSEAKGKLLLEMMSYSLLRSVKMEKFLMLVGPGGSGKTVAVKITGGLVGSGNASAVTLRKMGDTFKSAHIRGKFCNFVSEVNANEYLNDGVVKDLSSGELMNGEHKYGNPFEFNPFATLWLVGNRLPRTKDTSTGMKRRAEILEFNNVFYDTDGEIKDLARHIVERELSGVLNRILAAGAAMMARGDLIKSAASQEAVQGWLRDNNPVSMFMHETMDKDPAADVPFGDFYYDYQMWSQRAGRKAFSRHGVSSALAQLGHETYKGGKNVTYVPGVKLKAAGGEKSPPRLATV